MALFSKLKLYEIFNLYLFWLAVNYYILMVGTEGKHHVLKLLTIMTDKRCTYEMSCFLYQKIIQLIKCQQLVVPCV
jgi:hypothetical protein